VAGAVIADPPRHLGRVGRFELKADPAVGDERGVDRRAGRGIGFGRPADRLRQSVTAVPLTLTISIEPFWPSTS
jgi:hypothetical protein